jgi:xanthine dehydrogenase accessory factor
MPQDNADLHPAARDALSAIGQSSEDAVLAVITGIEGPAYRNIGTMMAFFASGTYAGALSSGCIEADLALHATEALAEGRARKLRYGSDSPFMDIKLPCGGALDIALYPNPPSAIIREIEARRNRREAFAIQFDPADRMTLIPPNPTGTNHGTVVVEMLPPLRFVVLGKGPEAAYFAGLVKASGYEHLLLSPESQTLEFGQALGCTTQFIQSPKLPDDLTIDTRTAVTLFFHDHDWEPPLLQRCLASDAFYIGAQGSRRVAETRKAMLLALGSPPDQLQRLRGPIGLIPSARDPKTLAVSVLAEILAEAERSVSHRT